METFSRKTLILYFIIAVIAAVLFINSFIHYSWTLEKLQHLLLFSVLAILTESMPVALPKGGYVSVSFTIIYAALVLFDPPIVVVVALSAALFNFCRETLFKRIFNSAQFVISVVLSRYIIGFFDVSSFQLTFYNVFVYIFAAVCFFIVNATIVSTIIAFSNNKHPWVIWKSNIIWATPNFLALAPLGILIALIFQNYGWIGLALLFIPLMLSRHSFQLYVKMKENYLNTIAALVQALEAKDSYTSGHSARVTQLSVAIAEEMHMKDERIETIRYAAVLHDVGKIGVNENILNKRGTLTEDEWTSIHLHPTIGESIIRKIRFLYDIEKIVRHHHERYDGFGYPDGIAGGEIPLESRIISVADAYDAMTSNRSYRMGMEPAAAIQELRRVSGTQLDPAIVEVFCRITIPEAAEESITWPELYSGNQVV